MADDVRWKDLFARFQRVQTDIDAVEIRSPSDSLDMLRAKMAEYLANDVPLAWLIDSSDSAVIVYEPAKPAERVNDHLNGGTVLPGFEVRSRRHVAAQLFYQH